MRVVRAVATLGAVVAFAAWGGAGQTATASADSPSPPAASIANVKIVDFAFQQPTLTLSSGEEVTWTNAGAVPHDVVDRGGTFDTQPILPGHSASVTFTVPGTYSYFCRIHPTLMNATIVVTGQGAQARVNRIQVKEYSFGPPTLTVATGSLVEVANVGTLPHSMTAKNGAFDSGIVTPGPDEGRFAGSNTAFSAPTEPGRYAFFCKVHPTLMHGVLIVTGSPRAGPALGSTAPARVNVGVRDFAFTPVEISVAPGGSVTWSNAGPSPHTATFDAVNLDTGVIQPGASASLTAPTQPGTYSYHCNIHPTLMHGVIVVVGSNQTDPTRLEAGAASRVSLAAGIWRRSHR